MNTKNKLAWFIVLAVAFSGIFILVLGLLFWQQLAPTEQTLVKRIILDFFAYFFAAGFLLLAGLGFMLDWVFRSYILPIGKLTEEVELIHAANPSHRIDIDGGRDLKLLVEKINLGAELYEDLEKSVARRVNNAKAELEEEKNILAAIMAELPDAVLICNREGQIILYNTQAKRYFNEQVVNGGGSAYEKKFLGIGRSIFDLIDKNIIGHALNEIHVHLDRDEDSAAANFVLAAKGNRMLRAEIVPILTVRRKFSGFIVIFNDITHGLRNEARAEFLLHSFQDSIRRSVASIQSGVELILDYPQMELSQRQQLTEIIQSESERMGRLIQRESGDAFQQPRTQWPLKPASVADLVESFRKKAMESLGISLGIQNDTERCWVNVDSYTMVLTLLFLLEHIVAFSGVRSLRSKVLKKDGFVYIDISWQGRAVKIENLNKWENEELNVGREGLPLYLKEILEYHAAVVWPYRDSDMENQPCLRVCLPIHRSYDTETVRSIAVLPENRPEFYNFDLFNQAGQNPDLDDMLLSNLTYTVFDTETTGLDPGAGDRIISIGAVRIVKEHMLEEEIFDQLVNPQRGIPAESTKFHGIDAEMVRFKPGIEKVLPLFFQFAADTILVAHNAAFDMRMLQMYEDQTKIIFINPVLDTLLLSTLIHPAHDDHNLSVIAKRLGVDVLDRHTAIGDAITTAMIFLKTIPLLANMGIRTLKEAREASKKTYYARLKY